MCRHSRHSEDRVTLPSNTAEITNKHVYVRVTLEIEKAPRNLQLCLYHPFYNHMTCIIFGKKRKHPGHELF